eukprot:713812_1
MSSFMKNNTHNRNLNCPEIWVNKPLCCHQHVVIRLQIYDCWRDETDRIKTKRVYLCLTLITTNIKKLLMTMDGDSCDVDGIWRCSECVSAHDQGMDKNDIRIMG